MSNAGQTQASAAFAARPGFDRPLRIVTIAGTRPEAIKLAPLVAAMQGRDDLAHILIATGQHGALFDEALAVFDLQPDLRLPPPRHGWSVRATARHIRRMLDPLIERLDPDLVIVQGDTTSAWAGAMAAHDAGIPLAHVEAGLRSGDPDLPWPEEQHRIEIDRIADILLVPTEAAAANLRAEGALGRIHITGNSGIDALLQVAAATPLILRDSGTRRLLVTCHRRENLGEPLDRICRALRILSARTDLRITVPLHPNPAAGAAMAQMLGRCRNIDLVAPLDYRAMVAALKSGRSGAQRQRRAAGGMPRARPAPARPARQ